MDMVLKTPTPQQRKDHEGDVELVYIMAPEHGVNFNKANYESGHMTMTIDRDGFLCFEFYVSAYEPWNEVTVMFGLDCANVEAAKGIAEIILLDIENTTDARWQELGFMREVV